MQIVSGVNPSNSNGLHLGNYFGAITQFLELQKDPSNNCFFFVANLHSLNSIFDPTIVRSNTMTILAQYIALGLDPSKCTFYIESDIPQIPYLQTILNNCVTVPELERMHGYKDKLSIGADLRSISAGLFEYPVLMASDILLFDATHVPVGQDQMQHVELTREIAKTFNNRYGKTFTEPESLVTSQAKILGIDGERKMSKSLGNTIPIFADEATIYKQIMSIKTDPARIKPTDPGDPTKNIAFHYLELLGATISDLTILKNRYTQGTVGDVEIKKTLYSLFIDKFKAARQKYAELLNNHDEISTVATIGRDKAIQIAAKKLTLIRELIGIDF